MPLYTVIPGYSNYVIANDFPHDVYNLTTRKQVGECLSKGYIVMSLVNDHGERKVVFKHRIIGKCFIRNPDPEHFTVLDHINRDKTDNRTSNLRWTSQRNNTINKSSHKGVTYEFIHQLPANTVKITHYNQHQLEDIYYNAEASTFYIKVADDYFRIMHQSIHKRNNKPFVQALSTENKQVSIFSHIIDKIIDIYPQVNEEGEVIEQ